MRIGISVFHDSWFEEYICHDVSGCDRADGFDAIMARNFSRFLILYVIELHLWALYCFVIAWFCVVLVCLFLTALRELYGDRRCEVLIAVHVLYGTGFIFSGDLLGQ